MKAEWTRNYLQLPQGSPHQEHSCFSLSRRAVFLKFCIQTSFPASTLVQFPIQSTLQGLWSNYPPIIVLEFLAHDLTPLPFLKLPTDAASTFQVFINCLTHSPAQTITSFLLPSFCQDQSCLSLNVSLNPTYFLYFLLESYWWHYKLLFSF